MNKFALGIIGLILGFIGACFIGYNSNFYVATGVFLLLWGNNIQHSFNRNNMINKQLDRHIITPKIY